MEKPSKIAEILTPGAGSIAREHRPVQIRMAELVAKAIGSATNLVIEAGVGTGKSFGYLVPAILSGKRTVVSTATIGLQSQLVNKDLPVLHKYFNDNSVPFSYAVAKGKRNYLCPNAVDSAIEHNTTVIPADVEAWSNEVKQGTSSGDKAIGPNLGWKLWEEINGESCVGSKCPHAGYCGSLSDRQAVESAKIVIANHAITAVQVAYRGDNYQGILGDHDVLIIDEAHKAINFFRSMFTSTGSDTTAARVVRRLLEINVPKLDGNILHEWQKSASTFFKTLPNPSDKGFTFIDPERTSPQLASAAKDLIEFKSVYGPLASYTTSMEKDVTENGKTSAYAVYTVLKRARAAMDSLLSCAKEATLASVEDEENPAKYRNVIYVQKNMAGRKEIHSAPLDIGGILTDKLYPNVNSVILTSATLAVGGNFNSVYSEYATPKDNTESVILGNVFDYDKQSVLYIPKGLSEPKFGHNENYIRDICAEITRLVELTKGRTLVLFTSRFDLAAAKKECCRTLETGTPKLKVMCQDENSPAPAIIEEYTRRYERGEPSVIFGLKSFWEGVSLEGELLTNVIITKLPFPPMSDPVYAAKCENSGNSFMDITIPEMVKDIKQGSGRLIRTKDDYGIVSILDGRVHTKRYGGIVLKSLPFGTRTTSFGRLADWYTSKAAK